MRRVLTALASALLVSPIVAATPRECQPAPEQVMAALNAIRAAGMSCSARHEATSAAAVAPLRWSDELAASAHEYALELAARDAVSHEGQVLRTLSKRVRAAGYRMQVAGENLAAGQEELDDVIDQWMASHDHCENMMLPEFQDAGLACVAGPGHYGYYWVLHLGRRAPPLK